MIKSVFCSVGLICLFGCGNGSNTESNDLKTSYSYELNGCKTEKQEIKASSQEDLKNQLCARLQDDKANNYCARELRFKHFEKDCPGQTWNPK